jgi:aminopeptidase N
VEVRFTLREANEPLVLDFRAPADHVLGVLLDGDSVAYSVPPDHIVIPARALSAGAHTVRVRFRSTDAALNRQDAFLYALFVPDRASTALPVFEQPDLKGTFAVTLTVPALDRARQRRARVARQQRRVTPRGALRALRTDQHVSVRVRRR